MASEPHPRGMKEHARCSTCKAWFGTSDEWGRCRRHAPRPSTLNGDSDSAHWPFTKAVDFCLEWLPREAEGG